ncbi:MAG: recombinase RecA [Christensenellales bacterium]
MDEKRKKALEDAIAKIEKECGKGTIMKMDGSNKVDVDVISTGNIAVDVATGIGGVPRGRIIEVYGPESSGKTTLTLHIIAEAQKKGGVAAFIDAEHALDPIYAEKLGVNLTELYVSQPDNGEQALDITQQLVESGGIDIVVIDSVAALVPRAEIEGEMGDSHVGQHARLMSQAMRKLTGIVKKSNTCVIFINQLREKVGVMFGNPEVTTGGNALKFYASMRIDVRRGEQIKNGTEVLGNKTKIKIIKNKLAAPFRTCECDMFYGKGLSQEGSVLDLAVLNGFVQKMGSWFSYGDERIGQGRDKAIDYLRANPELCEELANKILAASGLKDDVKPAEAE